MKIELDTDSQTLVLHKGAESHALPLYSAEAFSHLSQVWLKVGWELKYPYSFSWLGRPIIQLPEDVMRIQEVIYRIKPDVIVETGVAHGGSLIFYASLFTAMGRGRVIGVDIEIRPHNRKAIEAHTLAPLITLIEGSSVAPNIVAQVKAAIKPGEKVLVILDSNHSYAHVMQELIAYNSLVEKDSYIVATDGSMTFLDDVPRGKPEWKNDNPKAAAEQFAKDHPDFVIEQPPFIFNEGSVQEFITHWPSAYLRKIR